MRRDGKAVRVFSSGETAYAEPIRLGAGLYSESWLQNFVQQNPYVLPVTEIEPGFSRLVPVAKEVPCSQGSIDNVFVTPDGEIVICELKLWRNPQARREVVAQCLDYVSALGQLSYEEFDKACLAGQKSSEFGTIFDIVANVDGSLDEAAFVDAVSKNLAKSRILALAVGDGIRTQAETLADLLGENAGAQFSFALVELAIYSDNADGYFVVPSTLAKTTMIPRNVFVPIQPGPSLETISRPSSTAPSGSLTETQFFDLMAARDRRLPDAIRSLLHRLEPLGVYPVWKASLNLYRDHPRGENPFNLGYIQKNGQFYTSTAGWFGRDKEALLYHEGVAALVNGTVYRPEGDWHDRYATVNGKSAPRVEQLLPEHADELYQLMAEYLSRALEVADRD